MATTNADGLTIRYGTERGTPAKEGHVAIANLRELRVELDVASLPAISNGGRADIAHLPKNAYVTLAVLEVDTAFATADAATLSIGLAKSDGTAFSAAGIDSAIAAAALAANKVVRCDGTYAGGTDRVTEDVWVYATVGVGTYTAGKATLILYYVEV